MAGESIKVFEDKKTWYVVTFAGTDEAEAIPDFWLRDGGKKAVWPPFENNSRKLIKAIASRKQPDVSWKLYDVARIFIDAGTQLYLLSYSQIFLKNIVKLVKKETLSLYILTCRKILLYRSKRSFYI